MSRAESNLAEMFYGVINSIQTKKWWHFIRILGLPENDVDEISYEDDDITEQKYQMLSRWKSLYGYNKRDDEIVECLNLARDEISGSVSPELLNTKLQGRLRENRLVARKFYEVMSKIEPPKRNQFALVKLQLPQTEVDTVTSDYSKDTDELCYQMFLSWRRRNKLNGYEEIRDSLEKALYEFLHPNAREQYATEGDRRPTGDNEYAGRGQPHRPNSMAPSGDQS